MADAITGQQLTSEPATGGRRLSVLLAMAMFVLVVDTSLMNVSVAHVVKDLGTTVSGVQASLTRSSEIADPLLGGGRPPRWPSPERGEGQRPRRLAVPQVCICGR